MKYFSLIVLLTLLYSCSESSESSSLVVGENSSTSKVNESQAPSIESIGLPAATFTTGEAINIALELDQNVIVNGSPILKVNMGGETKDFIFSGGSNSSSLNFRYIVGDGDNDLDGVSLSSLELGDGSISNGNDLNLQINLPAASGENTIVKTTISSIESISAPAAKTFIKDEVIEFQLQFSEIISVSGSPLLKVDISGTEYDAIYISGHNTTQLTFTLTIPGGLTDNNGIELTELNLAGGTIQDSYGLNSSLSLTSIDLSSHLIDSVIPTIDSLNINSGSLYTNNQSATLNLTATDAQDMYITTQAGCSSGGNYESFTISKSINLNANVLNNYYVKVRDNNGNESDCSSIGITHDNTNPNQPVSISIAGDASDIATDNSTWPAATDIGPAGVKTYHYAVSTTTDDTGIIAGASWTDTLSTLTFQITTGVSLTGGTDYYTLVRTEDNAGNLSEITASTPWNIIVSPEVVTNLEASNKTVDTISLGWSYPIDNGTAITDYEIEILGGSYTSWTLISDGVSTQTSTTVDSLDPETSYQFKIRAFNGINYSGWSNILTVETLPNLEFFQAGYKAINISGAPKSKIVSFDDANDITLNGALVTTLARGETYEFDSADFSVIDGTKPFYVAGKLGTGSGSSDQGNATWATQAWVGDEFYFNLTRMAPLRLKVFAFTDSEITVRSGTTVIDTQTVNADSGHIFTINNNGSYQIASTGLIVAFTYGNSGGGIFDPQPLLPVSTDILGIPSSTGRVTSGSDGNPFTYYHSGGNTNSGTMNASTTLTVSPQGTSSLYASHSLRIIADSPITANSNADSDGYCQAPFVPVSMLKKRFGVNADTEWIALASDRPVTVTITLPDSTTSTITLTRSGSGKTPYKAYLNSAHPAGTLLESDDKFQAWYQPYTSTYSGGDDETIMFGWDD